MVKSRQSCRRNKLRVDLEDVNQGARFDFKSLFGVGTSRRVISTKPSLKLAKYPIDYSLSYTKKSPTHCQKQKSYSSIFTRRHEKMPEMLKKSLEIRTLFSERKKMLRLQQNESLFPNVSIA